MSHDDTNQSSGFTWIVIQCNGIGPAYIGKQPGETDIDSHSFANVARLQKWLL